MSSRSNKIIISTEAHILRELRIQKKLSMREAGYRLGVSDSTIAHIETGRMNAPKGKRLGKFLDLYEVSLRRFGKRVSGFKKTLSPKDELKTLIERTSQSQAKILLDVAKGLMQ